MQFATGALAYTRTDLFKTAYETDPRQMEYINELAKRFRALDWARPAKADMPEQPHWLHCKEENKSGFQTITGGFCWRRTSFRFIL